MSSAKDYSRDPIIEAGVGTPDIISRIRFDGVARNTDKVKVSIVIPANVSQRIYGRIVCEVKVFSKMIAKTGYHYRGLFPLDQLSQRQARQKAGIVAGAMTENLNHIYKDGVSEIEYANEAMSAFDNALARFEAKQMSPLPRDRTLDSIITALQELGMLD